VRNNILVDQIFLHRDRPIYGRARYIGRYLGFTDILVSAKTADFIGLSRCWQNSAIFITHPVNLLLERTTKQADSYLTATLADAFS